MTASEIIKAYINGDGSMTCGELKSAFEEALCLLEKQEQNRIIELPMPLNKDVWLVHKQDGYCTVSYVDIMTFPLNLIEEWGNTIFATREEAEARLKELRGEE